MNIQTKIDSQNDWFNQPISHARIGYRNLLTASTTSGAELALTDNTFEKYLPAAGSVTTRFQLSASAEIDYIGIGAHNIGTHNGGEDVLIQYATTVGGALTDLAYVKPSDNKAIMELVNPVTVAEIAIITNSTAGLEIGVIHAGKALQMQRPIYGGHTPSNLSRKTVFSNNKSGTGNFLSNSIKSEGTNGSFSWRYLSPDWYREIFDPFADAARLKPFFIKWRPDHHPDEVIYAQAIGDIAPMNMGGGVPFLSVSMRAVGHA